MQKHYETFIIITPLLTEEQMKEVAGKFRGYLESNQAVVTNEEHWGLKKLAYPINKKSTGFYYLLEFQAEPTLIDRLEIEYRRDERIMRYLTTSLDKYALEYNERRKRGEFKGKRKDMANQDGDAKVSIVSPSIESEI
jgi:small subunit ribosomal protein S6